MDMYNKGLIESHALMAEYSRNSIFKHFSQLSEERQQETVRMLNNLIPGCSELLQPFVDCFFAEMVPSLDDFSKEDLARIQCHLIQFWPFCYESLNQDRDEPLFMIYENLLHYITSEISVRYLEC